jgi:short-subunit dehydrogenase
MEVKDTVVIITGASSGIGEEAAKLFAKKGAKVVVAARSKDKLEKLAKELSDAFVVPTDMTKATDVEHLVKKTVAKFGRVDILINNAGRGYHVPVMQIDSEKYHELFDLDVVGPLLLMQQAVPVMKRQGGGAIVNISSGTSLMVLPGVGAYSSMKRALNAISLTAREELKRDNIVVSVVYPYITKTHFHEHLLNGSSWNMKEDPDRPPFDKPEHIAKKILEAVITGAAEVYAHDWMKR